MQSEPLYSAKDYLKLVLQIYRLQNANRPHEPHSDGLRLGQRAWNEVDKVVGQIPIFQQLRGSDYDPYYDDTRVPMFFDRVADLLEMYN